MSGPRPRPSLELDRYVVETLLPDLVGHDRSPSAFLVYLWLWARATAGGGDTTAVSAREIAEGTGLSKRAVQLALGHLKHRHLLSVAQSSRTATPVYTLLAPWRSWRPVDPS